MIELQRLTAMRPREVTGMRTVDIDTTARTWLYRPQDNKMEPGRSAQSALDPRAQAILRPWLRFDLEAFLFQPAEAEAERKAEYVRTGSPRFRRRNGTEARPTLGSNRVNDSTLGPTLIPLPEHAGRPGFRFGLPIASATWPRPTSVGSSAWTRPKSFSGMPPRTRHWFTRKSMIVKPMKSCSASGKVTFTGTVRASADVRSSGPDGPVWTYPQAGRRARPLWVGITMSLNAWAELARLFQAESASFPNFIMS